MAKSYPQFVLLGDSLIQNSGRLVDGFSFQSSIYGLVERRLDVVNRGFSGWNTKNTVQYLDELFPAPTADAPKIKYLLILLGANDAVLDWAPTKQHCPLDQYKENLGKIVSHPSIRAHAPKILLVTPPPLDEIKHAHVDRGHGLPNPQREHAVSAAYCDKAREVARENPDVVLIDLWQAVMDKAIEMTPADYESGGPWLGSPENGKSGGLDSLLPDGLHMSGDAYRVFFEAVRPHIGSEWADEPDKDFVYPTWRQLNL